MKSWLDALIEFGENKELGECPICKTQTLRIAAVDVSMGMGYGAVWCAHCKHAYRLSRIAIDDNFEIVSRLPNDLIFDN